MAGNGTWIVLGTGGDETNIQLNETTYKEGTGSISFDVDVSQGAGNYGAIVNVNFTPVDLSNGKGTGYLQFWAYIPDVSYVISFDFQWGDWIGSDCWFYNGMTTDAYGNAFSNGWNLIQIPWASASKTVREVRDEGLSTTALPVKRAGASFQAAIKSG